MQASPARLSIIIQSAFLAAKPVRRSCLLRHVHVRNCTSRKQPCAPWLQRGSSLIVQARCYSDRKSEIDKKVEDAKSRIEDSLDARVEAASREGAELRESRHETVVDSKLEAPSIIYAAGQDGSKITSREETPEPDEPLPSESSFRNSDLRQRFAHFMDNFQSHLFIASRRLNDLTGYSGIEALKKDIDNQENLVQKSRRAVTDARAAYADAIAKRSTTQREVNDLLHRKHAWTPTDLERFTSLYRSDHANEQAEIGAQKDVSDAEARYEEQSTRLGRTILARYHEEQIWSDKIRQMSTWGTWGLMGLNVLLFIVFQIAIEPWRRRRLVKGFEEKVELALQERDRDIFKANSNPSIAALGSAPIIIGTGGVPPEEKAETVADAIVEQIVDAVSGAGPSSSSESDPKLSQPSPEQVSIEAAAESVVASELASELNNSHNDALTVNQIPIEPVPLSSSNTSHISSKANEAFAAAASGYAHYEEAFRELFSEKTVVLTQKELTTVALEGAVGGAAAMGLIMALLRPR